MPLGYENAKNPLKYPRLFCSRHHFYPQFNDDNFLAGSEHCTVCLGIIITLIHHFAPSMPLMPVRCSHYLETNLPIIEIVTLSYEPGY